MPSIDDRDAWSRVDRAAAAAILTEAAADRPDPWPHPGLSQYARYWRDGVRTAYEEPAGALRRRTSTAVLAAALDPADEHLDEAADGLLFLCEQTTWCWAAHERFAAERHRVVPDPDQPFLDLGAAETVAVLAWADLILAPALDRRVPGLRRRMRAEADRRVIAPFRQRRDWHWLGLDGRQHNWSPWIHGHVLTAALLFADPATAAATTALVIEGLDRYLAAQPADGGCDEGYAYWWNGPARLAAALQVLDWITGGEFAPWDLPPLPAMARYPQRVELGDGWWVNVGDGPARLPAAQSWDVLHRWGRAGGDDGVARFAAAHRGPATTPLALHDPPWTVPETPPRPERGWLPDVQLLVAHGGRLSLAVKGGHNDENHNHNDVGSYIVAVHGAPVLIDLGQPTYTATSFTDRRYEQWVTRSGWHNLPVIGGVEQRAGREFHATAVRADGDTLHLELQDAYPPEAGCTRWQREAALDRHRPAVTITDTWQAHGEVRLHHVIAGTPLHHGPGELRVRALSGAEVTLAWDPAAGTGVLEPRAVDDPLLSAVWGPEVHRLVITPAGGRFELSVR